MQNTNFIEKNNQNTFKPSHPQMGMFALYTNRNDAESALFTLSKNGFTKDDVSMLAPNRTGGHRDYVYRQHTHVLYGALVGAFIGMVFLGTAAFLVDPKAILFTDVNSSDYIGLGTTAIGAIFGSLAGIVLGGATGALVGIGSPFSAAKRYGFYLKEGGIVLVVHLRNLARRESAARILEKTNGQDINLLDETEIWSTIIPEKIKQSRNPDVN